MRVMEHGIDYVGPVEAWKKEVVCRARKRDEEKGCGAKLEITTADILHLHWKISESICSGLGYRCSECGKYNLLDQIPSNIRHSLDGLKPTNLGYRTLV